MRIDRENRVKVLQNIGQYLIDRADELVPIEDGKYPYTQTYKITMAVDTEMPTIEVNTEYVAKEAFRGIEWSNETR